MTFPLRSADGKPVDYVGRIWPVGEEGWAVRLETVRLETSGTGRAKQSGEQRYVESLDIAFERLIKLCEGMEFDWPPETLPT
jgi:hypothetical protein